MSDQEEGSPAAFFIGVVILVWILRALFKAADGSK